MKYSQAFIPTLKEEPREAEISSHSLTLRAGLIRKIASGIYAFLPVGTRVLQKIENIVREEMNRAGAVELFLPVIFPRILKLIPPYPMRCRNNIPGPVSHHLL